MPVRADRPRRAGRAARRLGLPHAARDPPGLEPAQPRRDPRVRVRFRSRCRRRGVVDGARTGGGRGRVPRRDPHTSRRGRHRRPDWGGMRPLLTAGRYLLLRVGSILAVFTGCDRVRGTRRCAVARRAPDRRNDVRLPRTRRSTRSPCPRRPSSPRSSAETPCRERATPPTSPRRVVRLSFVAASIIAAVLALLSPVLPHVFTNDPAVASPRHVCAAVSRRTAVARSDRVRPRRGPDRCRRLPVPRPRRARLPGRRPADRGVVVADPLGRARRHLDRSRRVDGPACGVQRPSRAVLSRA